MKSERKKEGKTKKEKESFCFCDMIFFLTVWTILPSLQPPSPNLSPFFFIPKYYVLWHYYHIYFSSSWIGSM